MKETDVPEVGINFEHPVAFWLGTAAVVSGVVAHFPSFLASSSMGYHMKGMEMSGVMLAGMISILVGLLSAAYGLIPLTSVSSSGRRHHDSALIHLEQMDGAHLTRQHWGLLIVLGVALIVDVMKPATLGFVVPGMKAEYGITKFQVAVFPAMALAGTTIGSLMWGVLSDRIGRRAAILLASILFVATSICGFMPSFGWNLVMCFIMGLSAGGMLPIVYALMTESMPAKNRGWLVVLHGGMGTVGGYLVASGLAALLEPHFTWRILWFAGLPTGLLMLILNRWIPESPRFLIEHGRIHEAERIMQKFGVKLTRTQAPPEGESIDEAFGAAAPKLPGLSAIFRQPYLLKTLTVGIYGLAWGLVQWGFLTFTPTILRDRGVDASSASRLLFSSALIAVPATVLVAWLYGMWSSKKSMVLFAALTSAALVAFAVIDPGSTKENTWMLTPLMVFLLIGSGGVISMLSPYTAEIYPTRLRGTGSGFAAGVSKVGGMIAPAVAALILSAVPGFSLISILVAVPMAIAALALVFAGIETRSRRLEELTEAPVVAASASSPVTTAGIK